MIDWQYTDFFPCSYLPQQEARMIGALGTVLSREACEILIMRGFRRSGTFIYWPDCAGCQQCVPLRIPVCDFIPNRTQRKLWHKRQRWVIRQVALDYQEEHFQLYRRYLQARHAGSEMAEDSRAQYAAYMLDTPMNSILVEFRDNQTNELVMVSLIDQLPNALSSVYTFFDPQRPKDSLGTLSILWQIELAKRLEKPYVYLGYYIECCRAMAYKRRFFGAEGLIRGIWQPL